MFSYLFNGRVDQDKIGKYTQGNSKFRRKFRAQFCSQVYSNGLEYLLFICNRFFFLIGIKLTFEKQIFILRNSFNNALFTIVWISISLAFTEPSILGGVFGFQMNIWLSTWLGKMNRLVVVFDLSAFIVAKFNPTLFQQKISQREEIEEEKIIEEPTVTKVSFEEEKKKS